jgi:hypothetical protein
MLGSLPEITDGEEHWAEFYAGMVDVVADALRVDGPEAAEAVLARVWPVFAAGAPSRLVTAATSARVVEWHARALRGLPAEEARLRRHQVAGRVAVEVVAGASREELLRRRPALDVVLDALAHLAYEDHGQAGGLVAGFAAALDVDVLARHLVVEDRDGVRDTAQQALDERFRHALLAATGTAEGVDLFTAEGLAVHAAMARRAIRTLDEDSRRGMANGATANLQARPVPRSSADAHRMTEAHAVVMDLLLHRGAPYTAETHWTSRNPAATTALIRRLRETFDPEPEPEPPPPPAGERNPLRDFLIRRPQKE